MAEPCTKEFGITYKMLPKTRPQFFLMIHYTLYMYEGVGEEVICSIHSINILYSLQSEESVKVENAAVLLTEKERMNLK